MMKLIALLLSLIFLSPSYGATIYHWVDRNGIQNFTDDYDRIPFAYRNEVHLRVIEDTPEKGLLPTPRAMSQKEETKKDVFGLGKEWWRKKVQPWERQLEEASENYEIKDKEYLEESKTLITRKFGSHQLFKSTILGMDRLRVERDRYEARLIEAKEVLKTISKEAEESGADPEWVTGGSELLQPASVKAEGIRMDAYGGDEAWWRGEVLARRERLKEAVEKYEQAYEKYSKSIEELGPWRFGGMSLTQYQMFSCRLDTINSEMAGYEAQIVEASERLKKFLKEAEESKVNPDWVKQ
jgi:hypothetical protein